MTEAQLREMEYRVSITFSVYATLLRRCGCLNPTIHRYDF